MPTTQPSITARTNSLKGLSNLNFDCVEPTTFAFQVANEVGLGIVIGRYSKSKLLPSQKKLCEHYGVSRIVIREAIEMLHSKGMVYSRMSQGTMIEVEDNWNLLDRDILSWLVQRPFSESLLREFNETMHVVMPLACSMASLNANNKEFSELEAILIKLKSPDTCVQSLIGLEIEFHLKLLGISRNRFYLQFRHFISTAIMYQYNSIPAEKHKTAFDVDLYIEVVTAIKRRAQLKSKSSMRSLLANLFAR